MGEAARKIPEDQPDNLRALRIISRGSQEDLSVEARALRILIAVRKEIEGGIDPEMMTDILNELERLLGLLPRKPIIIKLFPEEEKTDTPEGRKGKVSERLRIICEEISPPEIKEEPTTSPAIEAVLLGLRTLYKDEEKLKQKSRKSKNVREQLVQTKRLIQAQRVRLQEVIQESKRPAPLSDEARTEMDKRLQKYYEEQITEEGPKPVSASPTSREEEQERLITEWLLKKKPVSSPVPQMTTITAPATSQEVKTPYYPHRHETGKIHAEALELLEEIQRIEPQLRGEARAEIKKSLGALDYGQTVSDFLYRAYKVLSECAVYFHQRNDPSDHPLFRLGQLIQQLQPRIPTSEQTYDSNVTKDQANQLREAIRLCLSEIKPDDDERFQQLLMKLKKNKMNPLTPEEWKLRHRKFKLE